MAIDMLQAIRSRGQKQTPFRYGVRIASDYVSTVRDLVGLDTCYRMLSKGNVSLNDLIKRAGNTLVYANEDMEGADLLGSPSIGGLTLPKNTLMVFQHCLTSSRKDRDGDTLHSDGATVDPKMLLLWQHVHTMPIGKLIAVKDQNPKKLTVISCIVDMNELCHDSAVMVDNDMARFSHGFRALRFTQAKEGVNGKEEAGFDVRQFEIMEESLVSVPANPDAETEEVLLSLVEGGKLKSPIMKQVGRGIREHRPSTVVVPLEVKELAEEEVEKGETEDQVVEDTNQEKEVEDENVATSGIETKEGDGGAGSTPEETNAPSDEVTVTEKEAEVAEVEECAAPETEPEEEKSVVVDEKVGRTLSQRNLDRITKAKEHVDDVAGAEGISRGHGAQLREASGHLGEVIKSSMAPSNGPQIFEVMAHFLAHADAPARTRMKNAIIALEEGEQSQRLVEEYQTLKEG